MSTSGLKRNLNPLTASIQYHIYNIILVSWENAFGIEKKTCDIVFESFDFLFIQFVDNSNKIIW